LETLTKKAFEGRELLVILVDGPNHDTSKPNLIGPVDLLFEGLLIIKANPLVPGEGEVLGSSFFVVNDFGLLLCNDVLDLEAD
jgi:hypothetical protein